MNSPSRKESCVPEGFPVSLRVLVVDGDSTCVKTIEAMLKQYQYQVTATNLPEHAVERLMEEKKPFDIVITDVEGAQTDVEGAQDGLKLLQRVAAAKDIPLIMMSAYSEQKLVMEAIEQGAVAYLVKPIRIEQLNTIWHHVYQILGTNSDAKKNSSDGQWAAFVEPEVKKTDKLVNKERDSADEDYEEGDDIENEQRRNTKKSRTLWDLDLHKKFVEAVEELGEKAAPKKIHEMMNVEGLTRANIKSHLQAYRLFLQKKSQTD